jgi:hypothetical protein
MTAPRRRLKAARPPVLASARAAARAPVGAGGGVQPPIILTEELDPAAEGEAYSFTLSAEGTGVVWSIETGDLPDGLALDPDTGAITGTPTEAGSFPITIRATNAGGFDELETSLEVEAALESFAWAGDGSDLTDTGGSGGDITDSGSLWSAGKLGLPGDPVGGWFTDALTPASGKFDLTWKFLHSAGTSAHFICPLVILSSQKVRVATPYAAGRSSVQAGDSSLCILWNGGGLSVGGSSARLQLYKQVGTTYTLLAEFAHDPTTPDEVTVVVHVDNSGATPVITIDVNGTERISHTVDVAMTGRYFGIETDLSGSGTTPIGINTINEISYEEVA